MVTSDESAVACARVARAFDSLLNAAMARLRLHYAMRISGLLLVAQGNPSAAVAALMSERDAAVEQLRQAIIESRRGALRAARQQVRRIRYRVVFELVNLGRPQRPGGLRRSARGASRRDDHNP